MGWLINLAKAAAPESMPAGDPTSGPDDVWWRVSITEPGGRSLQVDAPSGWTLAEWQAYAARYHGPVCIVTPIAGPPKPRAPANLDEVLAAACDGAGITPEVFRSLLSAADVADIEGGAIPVETLRTYALQLRRRAALGGPEGLMKRNFGNMTKVDRSNLGS